MRSFCAVFLFLTLPAVQVLAQDQPVHIDELFRQWVKPGAPGASVAVIQDGKIVFAKGYGLANLENDLPITPDTVFEAASISKQFTAMSIVLLEQDRKLSLEDEIHKYLPELPDYGSPITIHQLLQHTSGIRDWLDLTFLAGWTEPSLSVTHKQVLELLFSQRGLLFTPGTRGMYSNAGYVLLAEIVGRVSGKSLVQFAAERIFEPLGMTHTHFHDDLSRIVPGRASGYYLGGTAFRAFASNSAVVGPSGLLTTASDLVKWLDNFRDPRVGGAEAVARMQESAVPVAINPTLELPYALGLVIGEYRGLRTISHAGLGGGYLGLVAWYPDQHLGVAVLSNRGDFFSSGLTADRIASLYLESRMQPESKVTERTFISLDPSATKRFRGVYRTGTRRFEITQENRTLLIAELGSNPVELKPMTSNRFYAAELQAEVAFASLPGDGMEFKITQNGTTRSGERIVLAPFDPKDSDQYLGRYWSDELETQYTIALRNGQLFVEHPRNGEWPMTPIAKDEFIRSSGWVGVKFTRDGTGAVTGLILSAGGITEVRFTRR
jgi:CubicO group peptidase (beta-lactamase class C family)